MSEEVLRERVPWLDETVALVAEQRGPKTTLRLVAGERTVHEVCEFAGGEVAFLKKADLPAGLVSDAERLCLSVIPRGFNPVRMTDVLKDPFWQYVLDHMRAAHVMTC